MNKKVSRCSIDSWKQYWDLSKLYMKKAYNRKNKFIESNEDIVI